MTDKRYYETGLSYPNVPLYDITNSGIFIGHPQMDSL